MEKTLTELLLDKDYATILGSTMKVVENKIRTKIEERKNEIVKEINSSK
jgi:adenylate kinase